MASRGVTPNQISIASVIFAFVAASAFFVAALASSITLASLAWLVAAAAIQGRLVCNLIDGMVAVEGGQQTRSGELFNDVPDRIADPIVLVSLGYAASIMLGSFEATSGEAASRLDPSVIVAIGWAAGLLAVMTAYVRVLGISIGTPADFGGPMAKQHRMAIVTAASVVAAVGLWWNRSLMAWVPTIALTIIVLGCIMTIAGRLIRAYRVLETTRVGP